METIVPSTPGLFELSIDGTAHAYLKDASRWAKFLAIVGFIFCSFFLVFALLAGTLSDMFTSLGSQSFNVVARIFITIVYSGLALLNFFPCLFLYRFAVRMQLALQDNDQVKLNSSFRNMRSFYKFIGVVMIISLCFWALAMLGLLLHARLMHPGTGTGI